MMAFFDHNENALAEAWTNGWAFTPIGWNDGELSACIGSTWVVL
jgi:hypothetical protein